MDPSLTEGIIREIEPKIKEMTEGDLRQFGNYC